MGTEREADDVHTRDHMAFAAPYFGLPRDGAQATFSRLYNSATDLRKYQKILILLLPNHKKDGIQNHGQARPERNLQDQIKEIFRTILRASTPDS